MEGRWSSISTYHTYRQWTDRHLLRDLGEKKIADLTPGDLRDYLDRKFKHGKLEEEGGLSRNSVYQIFKPLKQILEHAVEDEIIDSIPLKRKFLPTKKEANDNNDHLKDFTLEKVFRLREILSQDHIYGPLFVIALDTGMRRCELLGLRWQDIDFDRMILDIQRELINPDGEWIEQKAKKSKNAQRLVELDEEIVHHLRVQRSLQEDWADDMEGAWPEHGRVFTNTKGNPPSNLNRRINKRNLAGTDLPRITFHNLRNLHIDVLVGCGVPYDVAQDRVGHSTVKILIDRYHHSPMGAQREALSQVREAFSGVQTNLDSTEKPDRDTNE